MERQSQSKKAQEHLRQGIESGLYKPGQRIAAVELAESLGMSRSPVHEALKQLIDEGLLERQGGAGVTIAMLKPKDIAELYAFLEVMEGAASSFAAKNWRPKELKAIEDAIERDATRNEALFNNDAFHTAIYEAAHNKHLMRAMRTLLKSYYLIGDDVLGERARMEESLEEHVQIFLAIKERDAEKAGELARLHIRRSFDTRLKSLAAEFRMSGSRQS